MISYDCLLGSFGHMQRLKWDHAWQELQLPLDQLGAATNQ